MNSNLGAIFRKFREFKGYSQEFVALKLGVSQRYYSKLERNEVKFLREHIIESYHFGLNNKQR